MLECVKCVDEHTDFRHRDPAQEKERVVQAAHVSKESQHRVRLSVENGQVVIEVDFNGRDFPLGTPVLLSALNRASDVIGPVKVLSLEPLHKQVAVVFEEVLVQLGLHEVGSFGADLLVFDDEFLLDGLGEVAGVDSLDVVDRQEV